MLVGTFKLEKMFIRREPVELADSVESIKLLSFLFVRLATIASGFQDSIRKTRILVSKSITPARLTRCPSNSFTIHTRFSTYSPRSTYE